MSADAGKTHAQIARELNITVDTARLWRHRWLEMSPRSAAPVERLLDAERCGAPAKFTLEQQAQLMALACEDPALSGRPLSQWSARELAAQLATRQIVERISPRHVQRLLSEAQIKPHRSPTILQAAPTAIGCRRWRCQWQANRLHMTSSHMGLPLRSSSWPRPNPHDEFHKRRDHGRNFSQRIAGAN